MLEILKIINKIPKALHYKKLFSLKISILVIRNNRKKLTVFNFSIFMLIYLKKFRKCWHTQLFKSFLKNYLPEFHPERQKLEKTK